MTNFLKNKDFNEKILSLLSNLFLHTESPPTRLCHQYWHTLYNSYKKVKERTDYACNFSTKSRELKILNSFAYNTHQFHHRWREIGTCYTIELSSNNNNHPRIFSVYAITRVSRCPRAKSVRLERVRQRLAEIGERTGREEIHTNRSRTPAMRFVFDRFCSAIAAPRLRDGRIFRVRAQRLAAGHAYR